MTIWEKVEREEKAREARMSGGAARAAETKGNPMKPNKPKGKVVFRRVRGRVVPIRANADGSGWPLKIDRSKPEGKPEYKTSAAYVGSGSAVAAVSGFLASIADRESAIFRNQAKSVKGLGLAGAAGMRAKRLQGRVLDEAKRFSARGTILKNSGIYAGGVLMASGVYRALPKKFREENTNLALGTAALAPFGASFLARTAYYKGMGQKLLPAAKLAFTRVLSRGLRF